MEGIVWVVVADGWVQAGWAMGSWGVSAWLEV